MANLKYYTKRLKNNSLGSLERGHLVLQLQQLQYENLLKSQKAHLSTRILVSQGWQLYNFNLLYKIHYTWVGKEMKKKDFWGSDLKIMVRQF